MPVIAIINRKGGSGKSTLATHLAAYAANHGHATLLGDIDAQQSSKLWLSLRAKRIESETHKLPQIHTWAHATSVSFRPPPGVNLLIIDTPGGLRGLELAKVVAAADVILLPVNNALFDMSSAADCIAEMKRLPKIANGACKLGIIGMRVDSRTAGAEQLSAWADRQGVPFVAHLRSTRSYVACIEQGLTLFDLKPEKHSFDLLQWQPVLQFLQPYFAASAVTLAHYSNGVQKITPKPSVLSRNVAPNAARNTAINNTSTKIIPQSNVRATTPLPYASNRNNQVADAQDEAQFELPYIPKRGFFERFIPKFLT